MKVRSRWEGRRPLHLLTFETARLAPLVDVAESETDAIRRALEWRAVPRPPGVTEGAAVRMDQAHLGEDDE